MIRFLFNVCVFLGSAALGLWLTAIILGDDFSLPAAALLTATLIFAIIQAILSPFFVKATSASGGAFLGGVGLISTFVSLWLTTLIVDSFKVTGGWTTWLAATVIVWLITAFATWIFTILFIRNRRQERRD